MSFFVLWLLMVASNIQGWLIAVAMVTGCIGGMWTLFSVLESDGVPKTCKWLIVIALLSSLLATAIPTKKEMAMIAAGGVTYNVVTSDAAKEVGSKSLQLLNKKIDELLEEDDVKKK
jgi:hypothetical protein